MLGLDTGVVDGVCFGYSVSTAVGASTPQAVTEACSMPLEHSTASPFVPCGFQIMQSPAGNRSKPYIRAAIRPPYTAHERLCAIYPL